MATTLQQIITIGPIDPGGTLRGAHNLNVKGTAVIPDRISRSDMRVAGVSADDTTVTVRNDSTEAITVELYLRYYHTEDRVYGDSGVQQLTPAPFWDGGAGSIIASGGKAAPQPLISPGYISTNGSLNAGNDEAYGSFLGYAWDDLPAGTAFILRWGINFNPAVGLTWGEVALCTAAAMVPGSGATLTPVGFADVLTQMETPTGGGTVGYSSIIVLTSPIAKGEAIYGVVAAANTNTPPTIAAGNADGLASGIIVKNTTPGWRPSDGIAAAFAIQSNSVGAPKMVAAVNGGT